MTRIPSTPTNLYAAIVHLLPSPVALCLQVLPGGLFRPEALGSPAGYAVPPGHRLLWPHEPLSVSPPGLSISSGGSLSYGPIVTDSERFPNLLRMSFSPCRRPYPGSRMELRLFLLHPHWPSPSLHRLGIRKFYPPVLMGSL